VRKTEWDHREISPTRSPHLDGDGDLLLHLLDLLATALGRVRADDPLPDVGRGATVERWEDDDHVYLESKLPGGPGSEIDISIHEGLVFIRIER
jgi:HSP20 family molecular chaperone IbpA